MGIFDNLRDVNMASIILRIVMSMVLGGILGLERGRKNRPAGFRTYMLVCLGATLVMCTNQYIFKFYDGGDIVRLGAQVISGIGFLGAGTIMVTGRQQIRGITTAAGMWAAACCGLAIGIGFYEGAIAFGIAIFIIMEVINRMEVMLRSSGPVVGVYIEYSGKNRFSSLLGEIRSNDLDVTNINFNKNEYSKSGEMCVVLTLEFKGKRKHSEIIDYISTLEGVDYVEEV